MRNNIDNSKKPINFSTTTHFRTSSMSQPPIVSTKYISTKNSNRQSRDFTRRRNPSPSDAEFIYHITFPT